MSSLPLLRLRLHSRVQLLHFRYRAFLSKEQLDELVKPSPDSLELVRAWLAHHGIRPSSISTMHGGNWLTVTDVPLPQANQLLGASYRLYRNTRTNETIIRTVGYFLPAALHPHIQTVTPTTCFPSMHVTLHTPHRRSFGPVPEPAHAASGKFGARLQPPPLPPIIVPATVREMYGTSQYVPAEYWGRNRFALAGDHRPLLDDLTDFMTAFQVQSIDASYTYVNADLDVFNPSLTSNAVIQYASAMSYPSPLFYFGTKIEEISLTRFLSLLLDDMAIFRTVGISYNYFTELLVPPELADSVCHQLARLGARGSSVLVASGNYGVGDGDCEDGEGNIKFVPEFPSSCTSGVLLHFQELHKRVYKSLTSPFYAGPWVTSVGGTQYIDQEVAEGRSGGGFSIYYPRPSYQDSAVIEYFGELHGQNHGYYKYALFLGRDPFLFRNLCSATGRGYPDISAQAAGCAAVIFGNIAIARGTACAVAVCLSLLPVPFALHRPFSSTLLTAIVQIAAGVVSLLNDFLISTHRKPLGFLNPWLYGAGRMGLSDITGGSNPGCRTDGFPAVIGWDPVRPARRVSFHFRRWLILCSVGHGFRDAKF